MLNELKRHSNFAYLQQLLDACLMQPYSCLVRRWLCQWRRDHLCGKNDVVPLASLHPRADKAISCPLCVLPGWHWVPEVIPAISQSISLTVA